MLYSVVHSVNHEVNLEPPCSAHGEEANGSVNGFTTENDLILLRITLQQLVITTTHELQVIERKL